MLDTWGAGLAQSFQELWTGVILFVPQIFVAIIIFLVGWLVGSIVGRWASQIIDSLKVDQALQGVGLGHLLAKAGFKLHSGGFIGALVQWFVIIVFLVAALNVLGLEQVNRFLSDVVLRYLPQVIVAVLILMIAAVLANAMRSLVIGSAKAADIPSNKFLGAITYWAIWIVALWVSFSYLGVPTTFLETIFTGLVAMLALAGGLAFGLGGRDTAARYLERWRERLDNHH